MMIEASPQNVIATTEIQPGPGEELRLERVDQEGSHIDEDTHDSPCNDRPHPATMSITKDSRKCAVKEEEDRALEDDDLHTKGYLHDREDYHRYEAGKEAQDDTCG